MAQLILDGLTSVSETEAGTAGMAGMTLLLSDTWPLSIWGHNLLQSPLLDDRAFQEGENPRPKVT